MRRRVCAIAFWIYISANICGKDIHKHYSFIRCRIHSLIRRSDILVTIRSTYILRLGLKDTSIIDLIES